MKRQFPISNNKQLTKGKKSMSSTSYTDHIDHGIIKRNSLKASILTATLILIGAHQASAVYFQGFETGTAGWVGATRVPTGTHGVPSKTGAFHAEDLNGNAYTFWGGASKTFPPRWIYDIDRHLSGYLA